MRRIMSAWQSYGSALTELYVHETVSFIDLAGLFRSLKEYLTEPDLILAKINAQPIILTENPIHIELT